MSFKSYSQILELIWDFLKLNGTLSLKRTPILPFGSHKIAHKQLLMKTYMKFTNGIKNRRKELIMGGVCWRKQSVWLYMHIVQSMLGCWPILAIIALSETSIFFLKQMRAVGEFVFLCLYFTLTKIQCYIGQFCKRWINYQPIRKFCIFQEINTF